MDGKYLKVNKNAYSVLSYESLVENLLPYTK